MPTCDNFAYMAANLVGEVGEFHSKIAKLIRKGAIPLNTPITEFAAAVIGGTTPEQREDIANELGDILWQLSSLAMVLGYDLNDIAEMNLAKLASRSRRGCIDGDGDNR